MPHINEITNIMHISRKIIKKSLITSPCDWLVRYYSFNLPLALKPIALIFYPHTIDMAIKLLLW